MHVSLVVVTVVGVDGANDLCSDDTHKTRHSQLK